MESRGRILLIEDDQKISRYLCEQLVVEDGYEVVSEVTAHSGIYALSNGRFDLLIVKFGMPDMGAVELITKLKTIDPDCVIIVLLESAPSETMQGIFKVGAYDFISRPINLEKLSFLVKKGVQLHSLVAANRKLAEGLKESNLALQKQNLLLARRIEESTQNLSRLYEDLRATYMRTIKSLAQAIEARDHYTHSHSENVSRYALAIAREMGLSVQEMEFIQEACQLHDLGKIGVEDSVLLKPSSLNSQEWEQIKRHPATGAQILEPLTFLKDVIELVRQHHEHYDGSGYPEGRKGEDILLGARIIHLADAFEAMCSPRSYRKTPFSKQEAIEEIKRNKGTQFDPLVVEAFLRVADRI